MNWTAFGIAAALCIITGVVSYLWGRRTEKAKGVTEWKAKMLEVEKAEEKAKQRIQAELHRLDLARDKFDNLPWDMRLELLGLKE